MKKILALLLFVIAAPTFAATLTGTVSSGAPLAGMTVQAYDTTGALKGSATSDATGHYTLTIAAGTYKVLAFDPAGIYATDFYPNAESFDTSTPLTVETTATANFSLVRAVYINGVVTSTNNNALAGITVAAYNLSGTLRGFTTTDVAGKYLLVVPPGTYKLAAYDNTGTFITAFYANQRTFAAATPVITTSGTTTADFQLTRSASIAGTITDAAGGNAIAGAVVSVYSGGAIIASASTDASGHYRISLEPGTYRVVAFDPAGVYAPAYYPNAESFDTSAVLALAEGDAAAISTSLLRAGKFVGQVADAASNAPLAGITVAAYNPDGTTRAFTATDAQGHYTLVVPPATYRLAAYDTAAVYLRRFYPSATTFATAMPSSAFAGQITTANFALPAGAVVSGQVTTSTLAAIAGVTVGAYDASGVVATAVTDANGNYRLLLEPGAYTIAAFDNAFRYATGYASVAVAGGQTIAGENFALVPGGRVSGTVTDVSGNALAAMTVIAYDASGIQRSIATTRPDGTFDLMLSPGTYELSAFDPLRRYSAAPLAQVTIQAGQVIAAAAFRLPVTVIQSSRHRAVAH